MMDSKTAGLQYRRFLCPGPAEMKLFGDPFRPLEPECRVVQFNQPLAPAELQGAANLMRYRPDVELYVYGLAARNLDFLQYFGGLRRLHLMLYALEDIAGFSHLTGSLEELVFGRTKKTFSLRFLEGLPHLSVLFLVGHKKDLSFAHSLTKLRKLGLSGITLPDLSVLLPLKELHDLSILLGATTNLRLLPEFLRLESFFLMRITKLSDLDVLQDLRALKKLRLDWMRNVTSLPSFARLLSLQDVNLDTMKGLTDLSPVALAPSLRSVTVSAMPQLSADSFRCFLNHPRLEHLWAFTGRARVNEEVRRMFPGIAKG
jgi:internalin A